MSNTTKVNPYQEIFGKANTRKVAELYKRIVQSGSIVIGYAGHMGGGIGENLKRAGIKTIPQDRSQNLISARNKDMKTRTDKAVEKRALNPYERINHEVNNLSLPGIVFPNDGRIPVLEGIQEEKKQAANIFLDNHLGKDTKIRELYSSSMFAIEAISENVKLKQTVFEFLGNVLPQDAIIATNTSSLSVDELAKNVPNPERVIGIHYFDPSDQNQLAEIIVGSKTSPEVVVTSYHLLQAQGKKPIIVWKDSKLATANRILVGLLNHLAKLADKKLASIEILDEIFLETFYEKQINVKFQKARAAFEKAPRLSKFNDEESLYVEIEDLEKKAEKALKKENYELRNKLLDKKIALLKEARQELIQKVLYVEILENAEELGSFFKPAESVKTVKTHAKDKLEIINSYLNAVEKAPENKTKTVEEITGRNCFYPYYFSNEATHNPTKKVRELISDHLKGAYIAIAQEIYKEGLSTAQDIDQACEEGFQYNEGPLKMAKRLGKDEVEKLTGLVQDGLSKDTLTGISKKEYLEISEHELSGIETYIQHDVGHIVIGRNHIQNLLMTQNSLNPSTLRSILSSLKEFESNPNVKAIFIESKGGKAFGSGADLSYVQEELNKNDFQSLESFIHLGNEVMNTLEHSSKPTIGIADGTWAGGSGELLAACQYRIGTVNASGMMPEVSLNLFPAWGGVYRFPKLIGKELSLPFLCNAKGRKFIWLTAEEACRIGFFDNKKPLLRSELQSYVFDLISGENKEIDIRQQNNKAPNYDNETDDYNIRKKFGLGKVDNPSTYKHKFSLLTRNIRELTQNLILNSDDEERLQELINSIDPVNLFSSVKRHNNLVIKPQIWIAQNKYAARTLEIVSGTLGKLAKLRKILLG